MSNATGYLFIYWTVVSHEYSCFTWIFVGNYCSVNEQLSRHILNPVQDIAVVAGKGCNPQNPTHLNPLERIQVCWIWGLHPSPATTAISLDKIRFKSNEDRTSKLVDRYILKYKKRCLMPADIFSPLKPAPLRRSRHETKKTKYITEEVVLEHVKLVSVQVPFRSSVHDPTSKLLHSD
jgi:hypothetical protein